MFLRMVRFLSLLVVTLLLSNPMIPAFAADRVRVAIASVYPPFSIPFAAQELGYYKERNLDVELTVYGGGGPAQEAMAAGAADMLTNSPMGAALAIGKGVKQHIVAMTGPTTPQGWYVMVHGNSPIRSMKDLNGKTIGITAKGSTTDFLALWAAKHADVDVRTIPLGQALLPAFSSGQVDAAILYPVLSYHGLIEDGDRSLADLGAVMGPVVPDTWVASDEFINGRADVLRRFLQANMKAVAYMQRNETWSIAFLKKYLDEKDDRVVKMCYERIVKKLRTDGLVRPEWLKSSLDLAVLAGVRNVPTVEQIFVGKFVPVEPNGK